MKPLDELEKIGKDFALASRFNGDFIPSWYQEELLEPIIKALKALEIIKEKGLSINEIAFIKNRESWKVYVETMKELYWGDEHLDKVLKTKKQYDLLKKVLE